MGCDIHLYVEYKKRNTDFKFWVSFGNKFRLARNYAMFGILSKGVRREYDFSFEQKGMPEDAATTSLNDNRIYISDTPNEDYVTLEKAKDWEARGCKITYRENGEAVWVTNPDWHSHSWLGMQEFEQAIKKYVELYPDYMPVEYQAVLASMKSLNDSGYDTRIVFWFDN